MQRIEVIFPNIVYEFSVLTGLVLTGPVSGTSTTSSVAPEARLPHGDELASSPNYRSKTTAKEEISAGRLLLDNSNNWCQHIQGVPRHTNNMISILKRVPWSDVNVPSYVFACMHHTPLMLHSSPSRNYQNLLLP